MVSSLRNALLLLVCTSALNINLVAAAVPKTSIDSVSYVVKTTLGVVKGEREKDVLVWRGLPYAQPPVGEARFALPKPVQAWDTVLEATKFGPVCPQVSSSFEGNSTMDENCLSLNIWSPATDGAKRPVMFWIHGGGFVVGSGSSELYNGSTLSKNGDVVVVTINYRLGALGFLHFTDEQQATGNFENNLGIHDQIAALKWVKNNISAFGGDPNNMTIFGESAGGTSVATLLACPEAKGLFQRAIVESGPSAILWNRQTATTLTNKYFEFLGISADSIHLLKSVPVEDLKNAEDKLLKYMVAETPHKVFSPTIDGSLLTTDIMSCLNPNQTGNVAMMIGTNKDEATLFASRRLKMAPRDAKGLDKYLFPAMKPNDRSKIISAYGKFPRRRAVLDLITDAIFRVPAIRMAENQSQHAPVYMYRFDWSSFALNIAGLRAFHGLEIPFVFGNKDGKTGRLLRLIASRKTRETLGGKMQSSWINFARYGNPNGPEGGEWKQFNNSEYATMIFNRKSVLVSDPDSEQRKAWEGVRYY